MSDIDRPLSWDDCLECCFPVDDDDIDLGYGDVVFVLYERGRNPSVVSFHFSCLEESTDYELIGPADPAIDNYAVRVVEDNDATGGAGLALVKD